MTTPAKNGWASLMRISHIGGWVLAALLGGMSITGWFHADNEMVHERDVEQLEAHEKRVGHAVMVQRMATSDKRDAEQDGRMLRIEQKLDQILDELRSGLKRRTP